MYSVEGIDVSSRRGSPGLVLLVSVSFNEDAVLRVSINSRVRRTIFFVVSTVVALASTKVKRVVGLARVKLPFEVGSVIVELRLIKFVLG